MSNFDRPEMFYELNNSNEKFTFFWMLKTNTNDITEKRLEYYQAANLLIPNKYLILVNKRQKCEIFNVFQVNYHIYFCFCSKNNPNIARQWAKGKNVGQFHRNLIILLFILIHVVKFSFSFFHSIFNSKCIGWHGEKFR